MIDRIPQSHHTVNDVMHRWPETVWLFMHYGMACAGCPVGAFHTVEEAALEYRIPLRRFLSELRAAVAEGYGRVGNKPKPRTAKSRRRSQLRPVRANASRRDTRAERARHR